MIQLINSVFNRYYMFKVTLQVNYTVDDIGFLSHIEREIVTFLRTVLNISNLQFKISLELFCVYFHNILEEYLHKIHKTPAYPLYSADDVQRCYNL